MACLVVFCDHGADNLHLLSHMEAPCLPDQPCNPLSHLMDAFSGQSAGRKANDGVQKHRLEKYLAFCKQNLQPA